MGYQKIENLYKNQDVLLFKECYVTEKIHGTSAHITWGRDFGVFHIKFFSGGVKHDTFVKLFDADFLYKKFIELAIPEITIYGEAYGGGCQGMKEFYGDKLKFIAFEVKIGDCWLDVPKAAEFVKSFDLEFVWYMRVTTDLKTLDYWRDATSAQAIRNGLGINKKQGEGIVIRPLIELTKNNGKRVIAKHKSVEFSETKKVRTVNRNEDRLKVLAQVKDICIEWVTENRLSNIITHRPDIYSGVLMLSDIPSLVTAMIEDVITEGRGELVDSTDLRRAISRETALMVKRRVQNATH